MKSSLALGASLFAMHLAAPAALAAVAENVTYDLGAVKIVIPRVESTGGTMTDADLRSVLDPRGADTLAQRLGKLTATSIKAPQLIFEMNVAPAGNKVIYRDIVLDNVGAGMIGSASVGGASGDMKDPNGADMKMTYGPMSIKKVNLALMLRMFTARRTDPNEPLAVVYEDFSAEGITMTSPDVDMTFGKMTGGPFKVRAFSTPAMEWIAVAAATQPGAKPSPEQTKLMMTMLSDMFQSMEFGRVEARDLKVTIKKEPGEVGIGRMFMSGMAKGKFGEIAYENFAMKMPDGSARLGRIGLKDFDLSRTLATMADAAARGDMEFKNTNPRGLVPTLGQFQIAGVDLDVPDKQGKGNSPDGKRILMSLGNFEINSSAPIDGVPTSLRASIRNFAFPVPKNPADDRLRGLAELGIDKIDLTTNVDLGWSEAQKELGVKEVSIDLPGLGAVRLGGVIGNVPKELFSSNMAMVQAAAFGALLKSVDLSFVNKGGVEKGLALQAKQSGQSPQQVQQMLVAGAAMGIPAMFGSSPGARALAEAVSKFAADPKSIRLRAVAKDGLGAADMMILSNPPALLQKVDITATANQ